QQRDLASGRHLIHRIPTVEAERHEVRSTPQFLQRLQDGVLSASWRRGVGRAARDLQRPYFARTWGGDLASEVQGANNDTLMGMDELQLRGLTNKGRADWVRQISQQAPSPNQATLFPIGANEKQRTDERPATKAGNGCG